MIILYCQPCNTASYQRRLHCCLFDFLGIAKALCVIDSSGACVFFICQLHAVRFNRGIPLNWSTAYGNSHRTCNRIRTATARKNRCMARHAARHPPAQRLSHPPLPLLRHCPTLSPLTHPSHRFLLPIFRPYQKRYASVSFLIRIYSLINSET